MRFYKIDSQGPFLVQRVSSVPAYAGTDEGRVLYDQSGDELYYGCNGAGIVDFINLFDAAHDLLPVAGSTYKIGDVGTTYKEIHSDDFYGQVRYS